MHNEISADDAFVEGMKWALRYFKAARANERQALNMGCAKTAVRLLELAKEFRDRANGLLAPNEMAEAEPGETPLPPRANTLR